MHSSEEGKTPGGGSEFSNLDAPASAKRQGTSATEPSRRGLAILLACSHVLALLIGITVAYFFLTPVQRPATAEKPEKPAPIWEYQVENCYTTEWTGIAGPDPKDVKDVVGGGQNRDNLNRRYNYLAAQGWEYVGPHGDSKWGFLVFKRPKR